MSHINKTAVESVLEERDVSVTLPRRYRVRNTEICDYVTGETRRDTDNYSYLSPREISISPLEKYRNCKNGNVIMFARLARRRRGNVEGNWPVGTAQRVGETRTRGIKTTGEQRKNKRE